MKCTGSTIPQQSSLLIQRFDMILTLNPGGKTFYFGPIGENDAAVIRSLGEKEAYFSPDMKVVEFVIVPAA